MNTYLGTVMDGSIASHLGISAAFLVPAFFALALWSLVWKGFALWHAARNSQRNWFVVLLLVNAFGILEIVYLIWFRRDRSETTPSLFTEQKNGTVAEPVA